MHLRPRLLQYGGEGARAVGVRLANDSGEALPLSKIISLPPPTSLPPPPLSLLQGEAIMVDWATTTDGLRDTMAMGPRKAKGSWRN